MSTNAFTRLKELLAGPPLQVGTVVAVAGGVATIELPGGGRLQARGTATVDDHVFFRDGVIEGQAPDLTVVEIEI